jgi:hypothetical protein
VAGVELPVFADIDHDDFAGVQGRSEFVDGGGAGGHGLLHRSGERT